MKKYIALAAVALAVMGCEKSDEGATYVPNEIRIEASIPQTRVEGAAFEVGDKMSLYAVEYDGDAVAEVQPAGNYINNAAMIYDGQKWAGERTVYWSEKPCDFYGMYPYQKLETLKEVLFDVATDQDSAPAEGELGGYEASDLLWAKAEKVSREAGSVNLKFHHMMSRVVVKVAKGPKFEGDIPDDIVTHIYNTATTAKVNYTIGSLEKYLFSENKTIKMRKVDEMTFEAIVVPQFIERNTPLVEITMGGIAYLLEYSLSLRPGMQHTVTVTLNTSPDQEKIEISIDGSTDTWN